MVVDEPVPSVELQRVSKVDVTQHKLRERLSEDVSLRAFRIALAHCNPVRQDSWKIEVSVKEEMRPALRPGIVGDGTWVLQLGVQLKRVPHSRNKLVLE